MIIRHASSTNQTGKKTLLTLSGLGGAAGNSADAHLVQSLGHATFDFIESRWGKAGIRQFIFHLRKSAGSGADPYQGALQISRDDSIAPSAAT